MAQKLHTHKVTINEKRRTNKKTSDLKKRGASKKALGDVFNAYYKDQVRALYRSVIRDK